MARAARQSGADPEDEDYEEFEEMLEQAKDAQVRTVSTQVMVEKPVCFSFMFNYDSKGVSILSWRSPASNRSAFFCLVCDPESCHF